MSLLALMDKTCTVQRATVTKDAQSGNVRTWTATATAIPCAIYPNGSSPYRSFGRGDMNSSHTIAVAQDVAAKENDRVLSSGTYYVVKGMQPYTNSFVTTETLFLLMVDELRA